MRPVTPLVMRTSTHMSPKVIAAVMAVMVVMAVMAVMAIMAIMVIMMFAISAKKNGKNSDFHVIMPSLTKHDPNQASIFM